MDIKEGILKAEFDRVRDCYIATFQNMFPKRKIDNYNFDDIRRLVDERQHPLVRVDNTTDCD